jgi:hypothetical protein
VFDPIFLQQVLTELASRGLLIADGATRVEKGEEVYFSSESFTELIQKARNCSPGATDTGSSEIMLLRYFG